MRIIKLDEQSKKNILSDLLKRSPNNYDSFQDSVNEILANVKENGDKAVFEYTAKFDGATITADTLRVTDEEIAKAYDEIEDKELVTIIRKAIENIKDHHEKQLRQSWFSSREDGVMLGQKITPLERVGVYVTGVKAAYT